QMPKLFESYEPVGTLLPEAAEALGLTERVKVCAGAGDNAAAAVGTGTVGEGACNISLGTSGTVFISSHSYSHDPAGAIHSFCHADGKYHMMGCMLSAASCSKWFMEDVLDTRAYNAEQALITEDMLGNNNVYFLPYLMGERSPINDVNARGTFVGISMDTTRAAMTQAVLEGVAFAVRDNLEVIKSLGIDVRKSMICGGGAKSSLWKKIIANVLNIELTLPVSEQGPGMGGAMLAMVACGVYGSVEEVCAELVKVSGTVKPDPEIAAGYEKCYQKYSLLYPALKPVFSVLAQ
ncbi:MAG: xylulokinase, partial [Parasporobacterium sp.]|nr:xylulokinase [Parasporobacterium sp.]